MIKYPYNQDFATYWASFFSGYRTTAISMADVPKYRASALGEMRGFVMAYEFLDPKSVPSNWREQCGDIERECPVMMG